VRGFKKGAAILAHHLRVPLVPVGIDGLFDVWARNRGVQWRKLLPGSGTTVRLTIGAPLDPEGESAATGEREAAYSVLTTRLRDAVESLIN
jgi:1-acyl-sn-glycerol-3-phosphate acyltransferase